MVHILLVLLVDYGQIRFMAWSFQHWFDLPSMELDSTLPQISRL